jgi:hypothetical protein
MQLSTLSPGEVGQVTEWRWRGKVSSSSTPPLLQRAATRALSEVSTQQKLQRPAVQKQKQRGRVARPEAARARLGCSAAGIYGGRPSVGPGRGWAAGIYGGRPPVGPGRGWANGIYGGWWAAPASGEPAGKTARSKRAAGGKRLLGPGRGTRD